MQLVPLARTAAAWLVCLAASHVWAVEPSTARDPTRGIAARTSYRLADGSTLDVYERSWAVVIGIDNYQHLNKLGGAVRDARKVSELLTKHGFEVQSLLDGQATRQGISEVVGDMLVNKVGPNDRVVVYFAGHGISSGDGETAMGYLMPVDGKREKLISTAISMVDIQRWFEQYKSKHVLYIADACYSGLSLNATRSVALSPQSIDYVREVTKRRVRAVLTAGASGEEASEYRGHGLLTYFLLEALQGQADINRDGLVTTDELSAYVKPQVTRVAAQELGRTQSPQSGRSGEGEFLFFVPRAPSQPASSPAEPPAVVTPDAAPPSVSDLQAGDIARTRGNPWTAWPAYDRACRTGSPRACLELAYLQFHGKGGPRSREMAYALTTQHLAQAQVGCASGAMADCLAVGLVLSSGVSGAADPARAAELLLQACDGGQMRACHALGAAFSAGEGVGVDLGKAVALYRKACDGGALNGCFALAESFRNGRGIAQDLNRALELDQRACDAGHTGCCRSMFERLKSSNLKADWARAAHYAEVGCTAGDMDLCALFGNELQSKLGVGGDDARARRLFQQSCDAGSAFGCRSLGHELAVRDEDRERGIQLIDKACSQGHPGACFLLGLEYNGTLAVYGLPQSKERARYYFALACDEGMPGPCGDAAKLCSDDSTCDKRQVARLYRKGCDGGSAESCLGLAQLYQTGKGVERSPWTAKKLLRAACDGGSAEACKLIAK